MPRPRTTALLLLVGLVAGCGGKAPTAAPTPDPSSVSTAATPSAAPMRTTSSAAPTTRPPASASARPTVRTVEIRVTGRKVRPAPDRIRVAVGERIDLLVTADVATEVHVHADPEIETRTRPGRPVVIPFTGTRKGVYEVELHHPSLLLTRLVVS